MSEKGHRNHGFSLTELLIVLAILGLLGGVAIPTIAKVGGFLRNDPDLAARELYSSLRAARIYSTTFRVETAVVYGLYVLPDSASDAPVRIIQSYGLARRMTPQEIARFGVPEDFAPSAFMRINSPEGRFQLLPRGACVLSIDNLYSPALGVFADTIVDNGREGLVPIILYDVDGFLVEPANPGASPAERAKRAMPLPTSFPPDVRVNAFPAHVFLPTGTMEPQASPVARFTVNVGPTPDASLQDRFAVAPGEVDPETGDPLPGGLLKVPVRIELFRTTGRVKMTS